MDKYNDFSNMDQIKNDKISTSSIYFKIGVLIAIIIFIIINFINNEPISSNIQLVSILFAGETGNAFYKYSINKKISNLILGIVGIVIIISAIILNI